MGREQKAWTDGECPRCAGVGLTAGTVRELAAARCDGCQGLLIGRRDLRQLLELLAREVGAVIDSALGAIPDAGGGLACPACRATMDHFGYMGSNQIKIDGCDGCGLLWLDADELTAMALLFARTELRREELERARRERTRTYVDDPKGALREARAAVNGLLGPRGRLFSIGGLFEG